MANSIRLERAENARLESDDPRGVLSADFDRDGHTDLAIADSSDGTVEIRLNTGDGTFSTAGIVPTGTAPRSLAAGDIDGDGIADLVTASGSPAFANGTTEIAFHLGDGKGGFGPGTTLASGENPTDVDLADIDADGNTDILTANENESTVGIFLGNGAGAFTKIESPDAGQGIETMAVADFDGDDNLDVAAVDGGSTLTLLQGEGDGGFGAPEDFAVDSSAGDTTGIKIGDFNRDGAPDIVTVNDGGTSTGNRDSVSVFLNDGDGSMAAPTEYLTGSLPRSVSVVDLNRDGFLDLAVTHQWSENVAILEGDGRGGFTERRPAPINGADETPRDATAVDVDGDGFAELAITNEALGGSVGILANQSGKGLPDVDADLQWTAAVGSEHDDTVTDIAVDSQGNVVVVGFQNQRASGEEDRPFIAKFDAEGEQLWFQNLGDDNESANGVAIDGDDNVFVTGTAGGTFGNLEQHVNGQEGDPGPGIRDIYLRKYSPDGEARWTEQFGSDDLDGGAHLTVDDAGNVFVAARSAGRFTTDQGQPLSEPDVAVTRFSNDGELVWSHMFGGVGDPAAFGNDDEPDGIVIDPASGELVIAGNTTADLQRVDIDGGAETVADAEGSPDHAGTGEAFVVRMDPATGELLRTRQFETLDNDNVQGVGVDSDGNTTVVGDTDGLPGQPPQVIEVTSPFAVNHDADGNRTWTRQDIPDNQSTQATDIAHTAGDLQLVAVSGRPAILVYDSEGNLLSEITDEILSQSETGFGSGDTNAVAVDGNSVYLAGNSNRAWAGDSLGNEDAWLVKLDLATAFPEGPDFNLLDLTPAQQISAAYVGYFGRAATPDGLDFWRGEYKDGIDAGKSAARVLDDIAESFRNQEETLGLFPVLDPENAAGATREEIESFVADVFDNLFDRQVSDAGRDFWAGEIQSRLEAGINIGDIIIDIASGARNGVSLDTDGDGTEETVNDGATLLNKVEVAEVFGTNASEDATPAQGRSLVQGIGTDGQSVADALQTVEDLSVGINVGRSLLAEEHDLALG